MKTILFIFFLVFVNFQLSAQSKLQGKVYMKEGKKNVPLVNDSAQVMLVNIETQDSTFVFTKEGYYLFKNVRPGLYNVKTYCLACKSKVVSGIRISSDKIAFLDIVIEPVNIKRGKRN